MSEDLDIVTQAVRRPPPVDVEDIIRRLGITYSAEPMPEGQSGVIEHRDGQFSIRVNSREGPQRQKFTAAHELAHYLLHRDMLLSRGGLNRHLDRLFDEGAKANPPQPFAPDHEVQANRLAADLLMPRAAVTRMYDPVRDNLADVARDFGVSRAAMEIRLKALGLRRR